MMPSFFPKSYRSDIKVVLEEIAKAFKSKSTLSKAVRRMEAVTRQSMGHKPKLHEVRGAREAGTVGLPSAQLASRSPIQGVRPCK